MNSMPGIKGEVNDFQTKWTLSPRQRLYGPVREGRPGRRVHRFQRRATSPMSSTTGARSFRY